MHPVGSGLLRPSLGSIHPESANETCNPLPGTESLDQLCRCFHSSVHDDAGREGECQFEVGGWPPRDATTNAGRRMFNSEHVNLLLIGDRKK
jgi:hypothetical protein